MSDHGDQRSPFLRPFEARGVPLHLVLPAGTAALSLGLLAAGGAAAVLGGWLLTIGFPLAVGAFVTDLRAVFAPAILWAAWLIVAAIAGDGVPQTPLALALVLAVLGGAAVWLSQRAVQPALHGDREAGARHLAVPDIDDLLAPFDPAELPPLDATAEVDAAIGELLDEPLADDLDDAAGAAEAVEVAEPEVDPAEPAGDDTVVSETVGPPPVNAERHQAQAQVETEPRSGGEADEAPATAPDSAPGIEPAGDLDDPTGHVIEFQALREEDFAAVDDADADADAADRDDAPLPAATEAGRRDHG